MKITCNLTHTVFWKCSVFAISSIHVRFINYCLPYKMLYVAHACPGIHSGHIAYNLWDLKSLGMPRLHGCCLQKPWNAQMLLVLLISVSLCLDIIVSKQSFVYVHVIRPQKTPWLDFRNKYIGYKIGNQDKAWVPHICCAISQRGLEELGSQCRLMPWWYSENRMITRQTATST